MKMTIRERLEAFIVQFSLQEREKRALAHYRDEVQRLKCISNDERGLEYINLKSEYENKRMVLTVFMASVLMSILLGVWKSVFDFCVLGFQYSGSMEAEQAVKFAMILFAMIVLFLTSITFIVLITHMRRMRQIYRQLMMLEIIDEAL